MLTRKCRTVIMGNSGLTVAWKCGTRLTRLLKWRNIESLVRTSVIFYCSYSGKPNLKLRLLSCLNLSLTASDYERLHPGQHLSIITNWSYRRWYKILTCSFSLVQIVYLNLFDYKEHHIHWTNSTNAIHYLSMFLLSTQSRLLLWNNRSFESQFPVSPCHLYTMGDKSVETLGSKIRFLSVFVTFSPLPPKTMLIFLFLRLHRPQRLHNIELGGRGDKRINARCK